MNDAADYVIYIKTFLISEPAIVDLKIVREETQGKIGLYRFRLSLANGDLLEIFERFSVESERVEVTKYKPNIASSGKTIRGFCVGDGIMPPIILNW